MNVTTGESDLARYMMAMGARVKAVPCPCWPQIIDMQVERSHPPPLPRARDDGRTRRRIDQRYDGAGRYQARIGIHQKSGSERASQFRPIRSMIDIIDAQQRMMSPRWQVLQALEGIFLLHRSGVPARFTRQAQPPLGDQVALDLVSAAVNRVRAREEEQVG